MGLSIKTHPCRDNLRGHHPLFSHAVVMIIGCLNTPTVVLETFFHSLCKTEWKISPQDGSVVVEILLYTFMCFYMLQVQASVFPLKMDLLGPPQSPNVQMWSSFLVSCCTGHASQLGKQKQTSFSNTKFRYLQYTEQHTQPLPGGLHCKHAWQTQTGWRIRKFEENMRKW